MAEEDKGGGSDKDRRPEGMPASRPQPVTPPSAAPGWVVPPNLRRAPLIPGASPTIGAAPRPPLTPSPLTPSPLAPSTVAPPPAPPPAAQFAAPPAAPPALSSLPAQDGERDGPSAPDSERPAGAVEPHLDNRAEPRLDERTSAAEAHEPRLGLVSGGPGGSLGDEVGGEAAPAGPAPVVPDAAAEQKPKRWGRISPPLMARAAERVGREEKSRGRGPWVLILLLILVIGGGVWLWHEGRLGPIQTLIAKIIPGGGKPSQTSPAAPTPSSTTTASTTPTSTTGTPSSTTGSASSTSTTGGTSAPTETAPPAAPAAPAATTAGGTTTTGTGTGTATSTATSTTANAGGIAPPAPMPVDSGAMITEIKQLLAKLDLAPGPIDGSMDAATETAIRSYQQMAGMPVDGQPSEALLLDLRAVVADQQPAAGG